jgi:hypothetical protein
MAIEETLYGPLIESWDLSIGTAIKNRVKMAQIGRALSLNIKENKKRFMCPWSDNCHKNTTQEAFSCDFAHAKGNDTIDIGELAKNSTLNVYDFVRENRISE